MLCITFGAPDRGRTGTILSYHGILSPGRLPIPPLGHIFNLQLIAFGEQLFNYAPR